MKVAILGSIKNWGRGENLNFLVIKVDRIRTQQQVESIHVAKRDFKGVEFNKITMLWHWSMVLA